jgi:hypothetical protein
VPAQDAVIRSRATVATARTRWPTRSCEAANRAPTVTSSPKYANRTGACRKGQAGRPVSAAMVLNERFVPSMSAGASGRGATARTGCRPGNSKGGQSPPRDARDHDPGRRTVHDLPGHPPPKQDRRQRARRLLRVRRKWFGHTARVRIAANAGVAFRSCRGASSRTRSPRDRARPIARCGRRCLAKKSVLPSQVTRSWPADRVCDRSPDSVWDRYRTPCPAQSLAERFTTGGVATGRTICESSTRRVRANCARRDPGAELPLTAPGSGSGPRLQIERQRSATPASDGRPSPSASRVPQSGSHCANNPTIRSWIWRSHWLSRPTRLATRSSRSQSGIDR